MTEKLGSQLREVVKQREKEHLAQQRKEQQKKYEEARALALPLFEEMKRGLPDVFAKEAEKGKYSVCVLKGKGVEAKFTPAESALCQMLISWAVENGLNYHHSEWEIYDGGEDPESLWLDWA